MGKTEGVEAAAVQAWELRNRMVPDNTRRIEDLGEGDFDELVEFWTR